MDILEVLQAILPPVLTGAGGWWFGRRKTNAEAIASEMDNVEKALGIYRGIVTDLNEKLERLEKQIKTLQDRLTEVEEENRKLKREKQTA